MSVLGQSDEAKSEGDPLTSSGVDAASEEALKGRPTGVLCCAVLVSDCPLDADEGLLKPPLPSNGGTEGEAAPVSFWQQYVMVQGQMFGAHSSMSDHSYGSRPQQWILLQKTLPYWLDSATNVSCSGVCCKRGEVLARAMPIPAVPGDPDW